MAKQRQIFTPKRLGHDYSDAEKYGEILVVYDKGMSPFQIRSAREIAEDYLKQHPPQEGDLLLVSGPASLNIVLANCIMTRIRRLGLLIFHARDRIYIEREMYSECDTTTGQEGPQRGGR